MVGFMIIGLVKLTHPWFVLAWIPIKYLRVCALECLYRLLREIADVAICCVNFLLLMGLLGTVTVLFTTCLIGVLELLPNATRSGWIRIPFTKEHSSSEPLQETDCFHLNRTFICIHKLAIISHTNEDKQLYKERSSPRQSWMLIPHCRVVAAWPFSITALFIPLWPMV